MVVFDRVRPPGGEVNRWHLMGAWIYLARGSSPSWLLETHTDAEGDRARIQE
jgi:hypothetical protein